MLKDMNANPVNIALDIVRPRQLIRIEAAFESLELLTRTRRTSALKREPRGIISVASRCFGLRWVKHNNNNRERLSLPLRNLCFSVLTFSAYFPENLLSAISRQTRDGTETDKGKDKRREGRGRERRDAVYAYDFLRADAMVFNVRSVSWSSRGAL
jgi:hypothetical protein